MEETPSRAAAGPCAGMDGAVQLLARSALLVEASAEALLPVLGAALEAATAAAGQPVGAFAAALAPLAGNKCALRTSDVGALVAAAEACEYLAIADGRVAAELARRYVAADKPAELRAALARRLADAPLRVAVDVWCGVVGAVCGASAGASGPLREDECYLLVALAAALDALRAAGDDSPPAAATTAAALRRLLGYGPDTPHGAWVAFTTDGVRAVVLTVLASTAPSPLCGDVRTALRAVPVTLLSAEGMADVATAALRVAAAALRAPREPPTTNAVGLFLDLARLPAAAAEAARRAPADAQTFLDAVLMSAGPPAVLTEAATQLQWTAALAERAVQLAGAPLAPAAATALAFNVAWAAKQLKEPAFRDALFAVLARHPVTPASASKAALELLLVLADDGFPNTEDGHTRHLLATLDVAVALLRAPATVGLVAVVGAALRFAPPVLWRDDGPFVYAPCAVDARLADLGAAVAALPHELGAVAEHCTWGERRELTDMALLVHGPRAPAALLAAEQAVTGDVCLATVVVVLSSAAGVLRHGAAIDWFDRLVLAHDVDGVDIHPAFPVDVVLAADGDGADSADGQRQGARRRLRQRYDLRPSAAVVALAFMARRDVPAERHAALSYDMAEALTAAVSRRYDVLDRAGRRGGAVRVRVTGSLDDALRGIAGERLAPWDVAALVDADPCDAPGEPVSR
jgi:hypothetical protein